MFESTLEIVWLASLLVHDEYGNRDGSTRMKPLDAPWALTRDGLFDALGTRASGLTETEAASRLLKDGPNSIGGDKNNATWQALVTQLRNPLGWLLVFASVVSAIAGEWTDAIIAVSILLLSAVTGETFPAENRQEHRVGSPLGATPQPAP